jgi:sugar-specific transcriptional regulator TrmB
MNVSRETLDALKRMGLTDYETRTYLSLNSIITGTASEISQVSQVPRPKVYNVLKSLAKKEFIEIGNGKPLKFTVIPPHEIFERNRKELRKSMDRAEAELNVVYENQIPNVPAPIWIINGPDKIINKEMEIIARAEESIFIMGGLMFPGEPSQLKKQLEKSHKKGIRTRIMTAPVCHVDGVEVPTMEIMNGSPAEQKFFPVPYIKLVVRDKQEMLIAFCKLSEKNAISETAIGIWNQYEEFVETINGIYEFIWNYDFFNGHNPK